MDDVIRYPPSSDSNPRLRRHFLRGYGARRGRRRPASLTFSGSARWGSKPLRYIKTVNVSVPVETRSETPGSRSCSG